jgi:Arc/MetJ-type ribon-helix-helix transcriptional regulator
MILVQTGSDGGVPFAVSRVLNVPERCDIFLLKVIPTGGGPMRGAVKEKVTVSLAPELVEAVDQEVRVHHAGSRSAVVEEALRLWRVEQQRHAIEQGTEAYYRSRSQKERREDQAWTGLVARQAKRLWND